MKNIADIIARVVKETHVPMAQEVFGAAGLDGVFSVMETVQALYREVDPERISGQITVFRVISSATSGVALPSAGPAANFAALANQTINDMCFEVTSDGQVFTRPPGEISLEELAKTAVVYHYNGGHEKFLAGSLERNVPRLDCSSRSQFSVPTFSDLRQALQFYASENVRESTCYIFRKAWYCDNRLFFTAGPESIMRDSLTQFLRNRLGADHDVWPEQNVNEKNPVDIRVQPRFQNNRLMLIEIKWLGDSAAPSDGHITAQHRDAQAQKGADQLAGYLDEQRQSAPTRVIQGYYVIIDARRRSLSEHATTITNADGLYYETQEISFKDDSHFSRPDFDPPYRMFARPVCSD